MENKIDGLMAVRAWSVHFEVRCQVTHRIDTGIDIASTKDSFTFRQCT